MSSFKLKSFLLIKNNKHKNFFSVSFAPEMKSSYRFQLIFQSNVISRIQ